MLGLLVKVEVYIMIYMVARRRRNQIAQVQRFVKTEEIANVASVVKFAFGILYVFISLSFSLVFAFLYWYGCTYIKSTAQAFL